MIIIERKSNKDKKEFERRDTDRYVYEL